MVYAHMWEIQKMLGSCGTWSGGTANPQKLPLFPPVTITKFCRSRSMCERVRSESSKCWDAGARSLEMGTWLGCPRRNTLVSHWAKCGRSRSNGTSVITEIRRHVLTHSVPPLKNMQGHREPTLIDRQPATM